MRKAYHVREEFSNFSYMDKKALDSDYIIVPPGQKACFLFDYCLPDERGVTVNGGTRGKSVRYVARKIYEYYVKHEKEMDLHYIDDLCLDSIDKIQNATRRAPAFYEVDFSS